MLDTTGYAVPPLRRSPLAHRQPIANRDGSLQLAERGFTGRIVLRGEAAEIGPALQGQAGFALPVEPCTSARANGYTVLWFGPSEWMLLCGEGEEATLLASVEAALDGVHHQAAEVSDYYTAIRASGTMARETLMKLTTLDLHPRSFAPGTVKGSVFGRVPAQLHMPEDSAEGAPDFDLIMRRSHADYLWCLLALAGREFGLPEQTPVGRVRIAFPD